MAKVLDQLLFSQVFCESVGVRKISNQFFLIIFDELHVLLHNVAYNLVDVVLFIVNDLIYVPSPITVNVSSRNVGKH